jgi:hypothetical protein
MYNFANIRRNSVHALHIWANFCLLGSEMWVFPLRWLLLGFFVLPVNSHLITCNYLWKELWVCLKPVLRAQTHGTEEKPHKIVARLVKSPENVWSEVPLHEVTVGVWCSMSAADLTGSILFLRSWMQTNMYHILTWFSSSFLIVRQCIPFSRKTVQWLTANNSKCCVFCYRIINRNFGLLICQIWIHTSFACWAC